MDVFNIAIVGATGAVGEALVNILDERNFPVGELFLLASERSAGTKVMFGNKSIMVTDLADFDFARAHIGLFSAGGEVSAEYAPKAAAAGCIVVDNTSHFRYDADIPLVVPEVNGEAIADFSKRNIIANPNCSTIGLVVALKPIYEAVGIKRLNIATYQAVSGSGKSAIEELAGQTAALLNGQPAEPKVYPKQIAFNVLPQIDVFLENGYTKEEMKMVWETQKIFEDPNILVSATCARVPVFYGHCEAVQIETVKPVDLRAIMSLLEQAEGVELVDAPESGSYPTPVTEATDSNPVYVGRVRRDISLEKGLSLWLVSDNIRKGAALNSIQIAELLIKKYL
ncbi:MAG: aspartate-semialdehyde dehydrogenase [Gammaproteobacteria bacterium]|nr:aspartate-semialdehyde dehydrogenase [Gammaproteobacteria bacterium]MDB2443893.1 aspartate-semialdehyde dehydrogenase [Gammaproteobacteria bacterium]MDG0997440.1 aspartate-semialdehyde dehydrogenase [Gammaproteobacteria bacterium]MDG2119271.1 aspartate-semialdehyde dehydrogenase [Gammaproteobacteria bacterium]